jgi:hypothetical protein
VRRFVGYFRYKVRKKYDNPKTPYERVLENPDVSEEVKESLREFYKKLNPAQLKIDIEELQSRLVNIAMRRNYR